MSTDKDTEIARLKARITRLENFIDDKFNLWLCKCKACDGKGSSYGSICDKCAGLGETFGRW